MVGTAATQLELSVVVTTRNRSSQLAELLDSLTLQTAPSASFEVVVVDDGSTDSTAAVLKSEVERGRLQLRVIPRKSSGGAAVGRDQGWREASTDLVAFTDDDCVPAPDWVELGLAVAARQPGTIIQGRTLPRQSQLDRLGPFARTISVEQLDHAFQTTNIFYPRAVLEAIGGFDTASYEGAVGGEDTDLAWRAIEAGYETRFASEVTVEHAVNELGPLGLLRVAARSSAVLPYTRHPTIRERDFTVGVFRKHTHLLATLALVGLALMLSTRGPRRIGGAMLVAPYLRALRARGILEGGGLAVAPYFALHDAVEIGATIRGGMRGGRLFI